MKSKQQRQLPVRHCIWYIVAQLSSSYVVLQHAITMVATPSPAAVAPHFMLSQLLQAQQHVANIVCIPAAGLLACLLACLQDGAGQCSTNT
jgi:hypothetical protein